MEWELESLLIPEVDAAKEAGRLLADMPRLWAEASLQERYPTTDYDAGCCLHRRERQQVDSVGESEIGFWHSTRYDLGGIIGCPIRATLQTAH